MGGPQRVLVVDGDAKARQLMTRVLGAHRFASAAVADTTVAVARLRAGRFDVALLDASPAMADSLEGCHRIREFSQLPLIVVSARVGAAFAVRALAAGADDYVTKPFDGQELVSRIRALLRRCQGTHTLPVPLALPPVVVGALRLVYSSQLASICGVDLRLSGKEFQLLYTLAAHVGVPLSRRQILEAVWDGDVFDGTKTLSVHISRLRAKLDVAGGHGWLVQCLRNQGYVLSSEVARLGPVTPSQGA